MGIGGGLALEPSRRALNGMHRGLKTGLLGLSMARKSVGAIPGACRRLSTVGNNPFI